MGFKVSEVKRVPIMTQDASGNDVVTFDDAHTLADVARWIVGEGGAEDMIAMLQAHINGTDGMAIQ